MGPFFVCVEYCTAAGQLDAAHKVTFVRSPGHIHVPLRGDELAGIISGIGRRRVRISVRI
jgi:hypothetical protein